MVILTSFPCISIITIVLTFFSHTILQKSSIVSLRGPKERVRLRSRNTMIYSWFLEAPRCIKRPLVTQCPLYSFMATVSIQAKRLGKLPTTDASKQVFCSLSEQRHTQFLYHETRKTEGSPY